MNNKSMKNTISHWIINILALLGLIFLVHFGLKLVYEKKLNKIYKNCKSIRYGMKTESIYEILGKDIMPEHVIIMSYDSSTYCHYLCYPEQFINEHYLSIQLDSTEKIVIGVSGCGP